MCVVQRSSCSAAGTCRLQAWPCSCYLWWHPDLNLPSKEEYSVFPLLQSPLLTSVSAPRMGEATVLKLVAGLQLLCSQLRWRDHSRPRKTNKTRVYPKMVVLSLPYTRSVRTPLDRSPALLPMMRPGARSKRWLCPPCPCSEAATISPTPLRSPIILKL